MGSARRSGERRTSIGGGASLSRPVIVAEVREGREVGARRLALGSEVHVLRRWERRGVPVCRGLAQVGDGVLEFVARAAELEVAGVQGARR